MDRTRVVATAVVTTFLLAASIVWAPIVAAQTDTGTGVPVVHIEGRGHGHGVGMSQWGAYTMGRDGASAAEILATFYPGTELGTAGGQVVVGVHRGDRVRVALPQGGQIRASRNGDAEPAGFPVEVAPGGTVELVRDGAGYHVVGGSVAPMSSAGATRYSNDCFLVFCPPPEDEPPPDDPDQPDDPTTTTQPPADDGSGGSGGGGSQPPPSGGEQPPSTTAPSAGQPAPPRSATPLWAVPAAGGTVHSVDRGRTYRGLFEFAAGRLRNHVDIEDYVAGMAEVPGNWPPAAVQAQAIAARTYALRAMASSGEICDTESCQVYVGTSHESAGQRAAVDATRGTVVLYGGAFASTFYSASGGGHSATPAEGFGSTSQIPYLQARKYPTANPKEWALDVALTDVAARLGYPGTIHDVRVDEKGPSGRALRMTITGDAGDRPVDPQDFRRRLGLQSTLFTVRSSNVAAPPPPPPAPGDDRGVVGTSAPGPDVSGRSNQTAARAPVAATAFTRLPPADPPLLLVAGALGLIAMTWATAVHHVTDRRRLHPLFALGTVVADLSAVAGAAKLRSARRRAGALTAELGTELRTRLTARLSAWTMFRR